MRYAALALAVLLVALCALAAHTLLSLRLTDPTTPHVAKPAHHPTPARTPARKEARPSEADKQFSEHRRDWNPGQVAVLLARVAELEAQLAARAAADTQSARPARTEAPADTATPPVPKETLASESESTERIPEASNLSAAQDAGSLLDELQRLAASGDGLLASLDGNGDLWGALGDIYAEAGLTADALRCYRVGWDLDPSNSDWVAKIFRQDQDLALRLEEDYLGQAADTDPERAYRWGKLGDMYEKAGRTAEALTAYERSLVMDPGNLDQVRAIAALDRGRATVFLEKALVQATESGDDEAMGDVADLDHELGNEGRAYEHYLQSHLLDPGDKEWPESMVRADPVRAVAWFQGQFHEAPEDTDRAIRLARAYRYAGRDAQAVSIFENILHKYPGHEDALSGLSEIAPARAIELLEARSRANPRDDEALGDLGDAYLSEGRKAEALDCYRRAHDLDPDDREWPQKIREVSEEGQRTEGSYIVPGSGSRRIEIDSRDFERMIRRQLREGETDGAVQVDGDVQVDVRVGSSGDR